jgi:hypothetical protein
MCAGYLLHRRVLPPESELSGGQRKRDGLTIVDWKKCSGASVTVALGASGVRSEGEET